MHAPAELGRPSSASELSGHELTHVGLSAMARHDIAGAFATLDRFGTVDHDLLVGAHTARDRLFTCKHADGLPLNPEPSATRQWNKPANTSSANAMRGLGTRWLPTGPPPLHGGRRLTLDDVGFGFMVKAPSAAIAAAGSPAAACAAGELFACALVTWLSGLPLRAGPSGGAHGVGKRRTPTRAAHASRWARTGGGGGFNASGDGDGGGGVAEVVLLSDCTQLCKEQTLAPVDAADDDRSRAHGCHAHGRLFDPKRPTREAARSPANNTVYPPGSDQYVGPSRAADGLPPRLMYGPFAYVPPPWLAGADGGHGGHDEAAGGGALHMRCYWGLPWSIAAKVAPHHNWHKGAALMQAMLHVLKRKAFYLKLDADTLLLPHNLLSFLDSLVANVHGSLHSARLYFGNLGGMVKYERKGRREDARSTGGWMELETDFGVGDESWGSADGQRVANATQYVGYAAGMAEGLTYHALRELEATSCLERLVAKVRCKTAWGVCGWSLEFEDSALGLCMHLLRARPVNCPAFHDANPRHNKPHCERVRANGVSHDVNATHNATGEDGGGEGEGGDSRFDYPAIDFSGCHDETAQAVLPRFPISVHPLKRPEWYIGWWDALNARHERRYAAELDGWQREAGSRARASATPR